MPEITLKIVFLGNERKKILDFREFVQTKANKISLMSFVLPVLSSVSYEVQHSFSMFGDARDDFLWETI